MQPCCATAGKPPSGSVLLPAQLDIARKMLIGRMVNDAADHRLVQINDAAEVPVRTTID